MSQKNNALHFVIHDINGQPQMIKVLQDTQNQNIEQYKIRQGPVKIIKIQKQTQNSTATPIKLSCASKLVQLPAQTLEKLQCTLRKEPVEVPPDKKSHSNKTKLSELDYIETLPDCVPIPIRSVTLSTSSDSTSGRLSTMSHATRRRRDSDNDAPAEYTTKRRRHADKVGKGLRHFSMKVCEKVRNKGFTSYNEVADELVMEFATGMHGSADSQQYDQKNIRRRVYDALNVLMAMNIISKDKKEIRWLGLPTNSLQECTTLEKEREAKLEQIQKKTQHLQELIMQHISFKSLIERNKEAENKGVKPSPSSAIHLPFIVVNTSDKALIDCSISNDKTEYMFNFNKRFQIHDDIDILKRMGLLFGLDKGECSEEELEKAKSMVPKSLESFVEEMGHGVTSKLSTILKEENVEDSVDEEETLEGITEVDPDDDDGEEADGNDYSDDDSSDVDV